MPPFRWNEAAGRYINARGRFVSRGEVRRALDAALDSAGRRVRAATQQLRDREISVARWRLVMRREIKNVHLYSAAAARGGWAQLTQAELGRVGGIIGKEYRYLDNFARQLRNPRFPRDGRIVSRAMLYAQGGRKTYHLTDERVQLERGMKEEKNIQELNPCTECMEQTSRGWVRIGALVAVGDRLCLANCRCRMEYR
jgi:hypothetical protein